MIRIPPYLQEGDTIGVVCPSGAMPLENMQTCFTVLEQWGFRVKRGRTLGTSFNYFSGTDAERLRDLQEMLNDETVSAVLCARGGYGLTRIIDKLDFTAFLHHPKWIVGYSDITVLHSHLLQNYNMASLHSPMASAFNNDEYKLPYVQSLKEALSGTASYYTCQASDYNRSGTATGELAGGNLCLLAHLVGSASSVDTNGKILFIEDIGEYIYNVDRMMHQLKRCGKLSNLAGLVVGSFTDVKDTSMPFGASVYDVVYEVVNEFDYPVCFHFPVGHATENVALKHGVPHTLTVTTEGVTLTEKR